MTVSWMVILLAHGCVLYHPFDGKQTKQGIKTAHIYRLQSLLPIDVGDIHNIPPLAEHKLFLIASCYY